MERLTLLLLIGWPVAYLIERGLGVSPGAGAVTGG